MATCAVKAAPGRRGGYSLGALDLALLRVLRTRAHSPQAEAAAIAMGRAAEHAALWHALALTGAVLHRSAESATCTRSARWPSASS